MTAATYPTPERWRELVGTVFAVSAAERMGTVEVTLVDIDARSEVSYSLLFDGPPEPILPQATYEVRSTTEAMALFLVPIGAHVDGAHYEAVFNLAAAPTA